MGRKSSRRRRQAGIGPHIGLSHAQKLALILRLRRRAPSEPWVEAQIVSAIDVDAAGNSVIYHYHDQSIFPPGQKKTLMRRCRVCGIYTPPHAFEHGQCLDHAEHGGWGASPSAVAIAEFARLHIVVDEIPLEPEDPRSLRAEIARFETRERKKSTRSAKN